MDSQKRGKASKRKGKRGELTLMHILRDTYGYPVRRGYTFQHESDVIGLPWIHIECKAVERLNVWQAYRQAVEEAQKRQDGVPVVFHHKSREGWLVTMSLEDWMDLYGAWEPDGKRMDKTSQESTGESGCPS